MSSNERGGHGFCCGQSATRLSTALLIAGGLLIPAGECLAGLRKGNHERIAGTDEYRASLEVGQPVAQLAASADGAVADASCGPIVVAMVLGNGQTLDILSVTPGPGGTYSITQSIDSTGDGTHPLDGPNRIAVDGLENVYITAFASDNAFKITPGGAITQIIDATGDGTNPLNGTRGISVDGAGNVYVTGAGSDNAFKITPGGTITQIIDASGDGAGNLLNRPFGVTVDGSGNVFVTGASSNNAFKITTGGTITQIIDATGDGTDSLDHPWDTAVDGLGNVYVTGLWSDNGFKIAPGGTITRIIDATGDGTNLLTSPYGIAVDGSGNVYVTGLESYNAFKITPGGTITQIIDATGDGTNPLNGTAGISVDGTGNVYVAGWYSHNAFKITPAGRITQIIDVTGDGTHALADPWGIGVDPSGNVYVAGTNSHNAFRLTPGSYDTDVPAAHKALLEAELETLGYYNDSTDDLFFVRFPPPVPCPEEYTIVMEYRVVEKRCWWGQNEWGSLCTSDDDCDGPCMVKEVFLPTYAVGGGTDEKDLVYAEEHPGEPLIYFVGWDQEIPVSGGAIPTVSSWGVVVMALLVLVGAKTYFGRRRKVTPS